MAKAAASKKIKPARQAQAQAVEIKGSQTPQDRREVLRATLKPASIPNISPEELDAHFQGMPAHYWDQTTPDELAWGLETVHSFFKLVTESDCPATRPALNFRPQPGTKLTRVVFCTWDRHGLLAKAAAAFSAVGLNILQAELFTRQDNLVLDFFTVADVPTGGTASEAKLKEFLFLLEGSLSEPPRFASLWLTSRHKFILPPTQSAPAISFDNQFSSTATLVRLEAADRLGLLCDLFEGLAQAGLDITEAHIETINGQARDVVLVKTAQGQKVTNPRDLMDLEQKLIAALAINS
jgi:[protein-PII] uridylyltransferase